LLQSDVPENGGFTSFVDYLEMSICLQAYFLKKKNRVLRVAELNFAIKRLLESNVPLLWVRGEISNLVKAASGHFYFR